MRITLNVSISGANKGKNWATEQLLFTLHYDEVLQVQTRRGLERYRVGYHHILLFIPELTLLLQVQLGLNQSPEVVTAKVSFSGLVLFTKLLSESPKAISVIAEYPRTHGCLAFT